MVRLHLSWPAWRNEYNWLGIAIAALSTCIGALSLIVAMAAFVGGSADRSPPPSKSAPESAANEAVARVDQAKENVAPVAAPPVVANSSISGWQRLPFNAAPPMFAANPQERDLESYFAKRLDQMPHIKKRHGNLRLAVYSIRSSPQAGNGVAKCEIEAATADDQGKATLFRRRFSGLATLGDTASLLDRACQNAVDQIFASWELS